jgi:hypothetical protein
VADQKKVYRPQGWISAVVIADGVIKGTWELDVQKSPATISVNLFTPPTNGIRDGIGLQVERVGKFLNMAIELNIS